MKQNNFNTNIHEEIVAPIAAFAYCNR